MWSFFTIKKKKKMMMNHLLLERDSTDSRNSTKEWTTREIWRWLDRRRRLSRGSILIFRWWKLSVPRLSRSIILGSRSMLSQCYSKTTRPFLSSLVLLRKCKLLGWLSQTALLLLHLDLSLAAKDVEWARRGKYPCRLNVEGRWRRQGWWLSMVFAEREQCQPEAVMTVAWWALQVMLLVLFIAEHVEFDDVKEVDCRYVDWCHFLQYSDDKKGIDCLC